MKQDKCSKFDVLHALTDPNFAQNPGPIFATAHSASPHGVFQNPHDDGLVITRHRTLSWVMRHPAFQAQDRTVRKSGPSAGGALSELFDNHPVFMNEPLHKPAHQAAYRAVSWLGNKALQTQIQSLANNILDSLLDKREVDLASEYAFALSSQIWSLLLGASPGDADRLLNWANAIGSLMAFQPAPGDQEAASDGARNIWDFVDQLYQGANQGETGTMFRTVDEILCKTDTNSNPKDAAALLAAMTFDGIDGAGAMTANMLFCLLSHPNAMRDVRANKSLIPDAWQEAARYAPPVLGLFRCPGDDVVFEDIQFPADVNILMLYAAGNRDPDFVPNPDEFDIHRKSGQPLSFGGGPRACVGRSLSKIQSQIALEVLFQRTKSIRLINPQPDWGSPGLLRAIRKLPVELTPVGN